MERQLLCTVQRNFLAVIIYWAHYFVTCVHAEVIMGLRGVNSPSVREVACRWQNFLLSLSSRCGKNIVKAGGIAPARVRRKLIITLVNCIRDTQYCPAQRSEILPAFRVGSFTT
jgi:hypothetical protein